MKIVLENGVNSYPLSKGVSGIDQIKIKCVDKTQFRKNFKIGVYKQLRDKDLISEEDFLKLTELLRTFENGHAIIA